MATESPEGSDPRLENGSLGAALLRRLPRILLVTVVLLVAAYLVLPFVPAARQAGNAGVTAAPMPVQANTDNDDSAPAATPVGADPQLAALQQRVTDADGKAANFKIANNLDAGGNGSLIDQQVTEAANEITAAEARRDGAQSQSALIRGLLAAGQPLDTVEDIRNSVAVQQLEQQKGQITAQRAQLLATFLPSHPGVITATSQIATIDKQIVIEAKGVADSLDAQAKIETTGLDALEQHLTDLKTQQAAETRNAVTLDALERDATADRAMLQNYLARYGAATADASAGTDAAGGQAADTSAGTAGATSATPASGPSLRTIALVLGVVGLLALAIQIGAVLILRPLRGGASGRRLAAPVAVEDPPYLHTEDATQEPVGVAAPVAAAVEAVEQPVAAVPPVSNDGLRRWFTRHAHTADALASEEPELGDPSQGPATGSLFDEPVTGAPAPAATAEAATNPPPAPPVTPGAAAMAGATGLANLSADLILGRVSIVVLASLGEAQDSELLAERLASDALEHGLSVAHVDAGSQRLSIEPGITDLAAEQAGFGDVVFKVQEGLAEIPWGHQDALDHDSDKPAMLIEALSEVYEVVLVAAGSISSGTSLALFAALESRLVLVGSTDPAHLEACRAEATRLGFRQIEVLATPNWHAEVA